MENKEFSEALIKNGFISLIWEKVASLIESELINIDNLKLFYIYFVLVSDGNCAMSLNKEILKEKWINKCDTMKISLNEDENNSINDIDDIKFEGLKAINNLNELQEENKVIGEDKLFIIENNNLYARMYYNAKKDVKEAILRLFNIDLYNNAKASFDSNSIKIKLASKQIEIIEKGYNNNLIVTGGPGTGKTTSICFLLCKLFEKYQNYNLYLTASSGKAASRMKESVLNSIKLFKDDYLKEHEDIIAKLLASEEYTIHRLLSYDPKTNGFKYNKKHQFNKESIFIIDEASMIDVCLFASLLDAIPTEARVFILGDKDQLPSVGAGAVFSDLLNEPKLDNFKVKLDKSNRFDESSNIYKLANQINNESATLDLKEFIDLDNLDIIDVKKEYDEKLKRNKNINEIFYFNDQYEKNDEKLKIDNAIYKWGKKFYDGYDIECTSIDFNDKDTLIKISKKIEKAKILSAQNKGNRGVNNLNKIIKDNFFKLNHKNDVIGFSEGMILMLNTNNTPLELYNGDTGVLVSLKDDKTLYFMIEKSVSFLSKDEYRKDKIFKMNSFVFYPLRMLDLKNITLAFAITIHKSQGSDYENIFVMLPKEKGHPLLNRQIVYTAITRTKGNTYIYSNNDRLKEAKDNILIRDTNIFD